MSGRPAKSRAVPDAHLRIFLDAYRQHASQTKAAQVAGHYLAAIRNAMTYPGYEWALQEYHEIRDDWATAAEDELHRRAVDGVIKPVWHQGVEVGQVREYSDSLLQFLLKAARPERYRERSAVELTGANGGPVQFASEAEAAQRVKELLEIAEARKAASASSVDDLI